MIDRLSADLKAAMKTGDKDKMLTIRGILTELKRDRVAKMKDLDEGEIVVVLKRCAKMRHDAIELYRKGNREDLASAEERELAIINSYLPEEMGEAEMEQAVKKIVEEVGAAGKQDFGKVMKAVMAQHRGRIDGNKAREIINRLLG
jgi:hypothetical protein